MPNIKVLLNRLFDRKRITPTPLNTAQIAERIPVPAREDAFFPATIENACIL